VLVTLIVDDIDVVLAASTVFDDTEAALVTLIVV
jgi:hypothetical protein